MKDNEKILAAVHSAVLALPGIGDVTAQPWRDPVRLAGRHLAELLPTAAGAEPEAGPPRPAQPTSQSKEPSFLDGGPLELPADYPRTLQAALRRAASQAPDRGITFLLADGSAEYVGYPELLAEAERALAGLRSLGLRPGDSAIFQFEANRAFVTAYWGCVLGGFLPTPLAVAPDYERGADRLRNTWRLLDRPVVLTDQPAAHTLPELWQEDVRVITFAELLDGDRDPEWFPAEPDSPVLNLLTSGSTGVPKCVRHHNASLVNRTWADTVVNELTCAEVTLNSMAMDHVMGSVMSHTRDVFLTCTQVNVRTEMFLQRPLNWLDWTDRYHVTNLSAPNFAFALLAEHADEIAAGHWDLSSLRLIYNAGEPIVSRTAHLFLDLLGAHGLPPAAMVPAWGMSETSSAVTHARLSRTDRDLGVVVIDQDTMTGDLLPAGPDTARTVTFTAVGGPIPGIRLRMVDSAGTVVPRGRVGRLEITGDTMMAGYYRNDTANAEAYTEDGWFRTGDLAFVWDDGIVIAGRERDLIIVNGANYLCHEIEAVVSGVPGVLPTGAAAGGFFDPDIGTDRLLVFFVPEPGSRPVELVRAIRATVAARIGLAPYQVIPLDSAEFPRTDSGKIQRAQLLSAYSSGEYTERLRQLAVLDEGPDTLPSWFYAPVWVESELDSRPAQHGAVLLFAEEMPAGAAGRMILVRTTDGPSQLDPDGYRLNPGDEQAYAELLAAVGPIAGVVHAWTLTSAKDALGRGTYSVVRLVRALEKSGQPEAALVVLTRLDQDVVNGALVGLLRTLATERPAAVTRLVDVVGDWSADDVVAEVGTAADPVVRYDRGRRLASRLEPVAIPESLDFPSGGWYVVIGGLGGLGREVTDFLVSSRGAKVVALGRSNVRTCPKALRTNASTWWMSTHCGPVWNGPSELLVGRRQVCCSWPGSLSTIAGNSSRTIWWPVSRSRLSSDSSLPRSPVRWRSRKSWQTGRTVGWWSSPLSTAISAAPASARTRRRAAFRTSSPSGGPTAVIASRRWPGATGAASE